MTVKAGYHYGEDRDQESLVLYLYIWVSWETDFQEFTGHHPSNDQLGATL